MAKTLTDVSTEVADAQGRIQQWIRETPVEHSNWLSQLTGCEVFLKLENLQVTGSFKARGAFSKLSVLGPESAGRVVAASAGNHGAAIAYALQACQSTGIVFVPNSVARHQVESITCHGVEVVKYGDDCVDTEAEARGYAAERGLPYVSPYNDPAVIAGQGTIGLEVARQLGRCDAISLALGGGGLIAGVGAYLKTVQPDIQLIACSPANSPAMHEALAAGRIVDVDIRETLSHSTAGGVEDDSMTLPLCRAVVDQRVLVEESEIAAMMIEFLERHHMLIEGAAAVAVAGFVKLASDWAGRRVVIVVCGANVSRIQLQRALSLCP